MCLHFLSKFTFVLKLQGFFLLFFPPEYYTSSLFFFFLLNGGFTYLLVTITPYPRSVTQPLLILDQQRVSAFLELVFLFKSHFLGFQRTNIWC